MIGPQLRKALVWAAVIYVIFALVGAGAQIVEVLNRRDAYSETPWWQFPMMSLAALVSSLVQAGILLALLSIDKRLERRT